MNKKEKIAINGFGRIGRVTLRAWWERYRDRVDIVSLNTSGSMDIDGIAHLLKHDSVYGRFPAKVEALGPEKGEEIGRLLVGKRKIAVLAQRNPKRIRWNDYDVEVVLECTGVFLDRSAEDHFKNGAQKVIISAPPKDWTIPVFLLGVNADCYKGERLISNGSCTTNAVAPLVKLIDKQFGFQECVVSTAHSYTASQNLVDKSHHDLRRARAAAVNIVPTGTGAAKTVVATYPEAKGRFVASAIRVPVVAGSYVNFVFKIGRGTTVDQLNSVMEEAAGGKLVGIVKVSYEPLVSTDIIGNSASAVVDLPMTQVVSDDMIHISAWYDNEYGYSCRLIELSCMVQEKK